MIEAYLIGCITLFGLLFGSFANVLVHRLPRRESIVFPGSHCPKCGHPIAWYDNIPLFSWLRLHGKCRHCAAPIHWRYPLLELAMGASWGFLAWYFGIHPILIEVIVLISLLWVLTLIDLETGLLPDRLTLPGIAFGLFFSLWYGDWIGSLIGAIAGYGVFWTVARLFLLATGREGMGYGDFKLLAMLGAFFGWQALPLIILISSTVGAVVGSLFLLLSGKDRHYEIPFGPYLALAGVIWLFEGNRLYHWYVGILQ